MASACAAVVALAAMGSMGLALLCRLDLGLTPLERMAYGVPLGVVVSSLALIPLASLFGLRAALVWIVAAAAAAGAWGIGPRGWWRAFVRPRSPVSVAACVVMAALVLRWILLFRTTLFVTQDGLIAGHRNIWGDWAQHLGDVCSFAFGDNFPPTHPRLAGLPFAYHYLTSVTVASMAALGMDPIAALPLHSFIFCIFVALSVYAFAKRLTARGDVAAISLLLFLVGGGLGWTLTLKDVLHAPHPLTELFLKPWDGAAQLDQNYRWLNVFFSLVYPQRAFLYGIPLGLCVVTLLAIASARPARRRFFLAAGLIAGALPLAHLGTFLSLALITPFLFLMFPSRGWFWFFGAWIVVAVPQLWVQQGGGPGAAGAIRFHWGWVTGADSWPWFWLKNLGAFIPLLGSALVDRELLERAPTRVLWAFMPIFPIANLIAFQPWDWDNSKILVYGFLAACVLVSAALMKLWREFPSLPVRAFLAATIVTMTLSGVLENAAQLLGRDRHLMLTTEEMEVASAVRSKTEPHAIFAAGLQHNHPVPVLGGRRVLTSFPGWMWSQGAVTAQREHDLREIFAFGPGARGLLAKYHVDYVVIGPNETEKMGADAGAFRNAFPAIVETASYTIFDVRRRP